MAGTGPGDLHDLASELLAASVDALDTIPTFEPGLEGAPARSYVSPGLPALDCCDQLTVHVAGVNESPVGESNTHRTQGRKNIVTFVVTATRCHNVQVLPPPVEVLEEVSEQVNADGWALWNHLWNLMRAGELFSICSQVFWDGLRALNPSGGCGGWTLTIRGEVEGYEEVISS